MNMLENILILGALDEVLRLDIRQLKYHLVHEAVVTYQSYPVPVFLSTQRAGEGVQLLTNIVEVIAFTFDNPNESFHCM